MLVALVGAAALVVDVGVWFVAKRQAQSAADAAALAAVALLPRGRSTMDAYVASLDAQNLPNGAVALTPFTSGGPALDAVRADATTNAPTVFARVVGVDH